VKLETKGINSQEAVLYFIMKPALHKHLETVILTVALLASSVGLPVIAPACPVMEKCPVGSSCCKEQTAKQNADLAPFASYASCSRTVVVSYLKFESTEVKSTNFVQQQKASFSGPSGAVFSSTLSQHPSLDVPSVSYFSPPGSFYQLSLPLRI
jgi:hypothetical protein